MGKKLFFGALTIFLLAILNPFSIQPDSISKVERTYIRPTQKGKKKTIDERAMFSDARILDEYYKQVNPLTGEISKTDKQLEFSQARNSQINDGSLNRRLMESDYINRGPTNFGGRSRSLVIDRSDTSGNTMLAGAVSGGVFRTTNGGASWNKVSSNEEIHNVTTIVQDPRTGFENIWYYGTGESYIGSSQGSLSGSFYLGQGIWQSTDGGISWLQMPSTASQQEQVDSFFDIVMRLAIHPNTGDLYMAGLSRLLRFDGNSWFSEIQNSDSEFWSDEETDIVFTTDGRAYAGFSGGNDNVKGVWTSPNGIGNWTLINDGFFIPTGRVVLAIAPSNENKLYTLFVNGNTGSCTGPTQEADLWLWDQTTQTYTDYTNVLPFEGGCLEYTDPFFVQGGWDLCVSVKPDNENFVVIGGTNAYKKEDITDSSTRFIRIGGYFSDSQYGYYTGGTGIPHHPDIHDLVFSSSNPNILFSATDGGLHRTDDISATTVGWQNLNNNYQTYQFYHVGIDPLTGSDMIIGGAQDNGTNIGGTGFGLPDLTTQFEAGGGDGVAVHISRYQGACLGFAGSQLGPIIRASCDLSTLDEITPTFAQSQFVTYFYLDPDNNNALYYAGLNWLYKTTDASNVTSSTWVSMGNTSTAFGDNDNFQTFSTSKDTYNASTSYLLMGGDSGHIYRLDDPWNAVNIASSTDITPSNATLAFPSIVTGLAIHPTNNDIVLATYSNYGINSIFITTDATNSNPSWTLVERNLSAHSVRSAAITEVDGETLYFVGTARGLYSSSNPSTQDWVREAPNQIGFALVSSLSYRHSDNHLLIGTFGNGIYEAVLSPSLGVNELDDISNLIRLYPNPAVSNLNIKFPGNNIDLSYNILNLLGQQIVRGDLNNNSIDVSNLKTGMYIIELTGHNKKGIKRFIIK